MQKIPAWKYTSIGHYHYEKLNLGSAKDAMEKLDECALQDLTFRKSPANLKIQNERYKAIREELLTAIFYDCECSREPEKKPLPCFYFDAEDEHDLDKVDQETKEQKEASTTRYTKHIEDARNQYATSNEPGAEMVLDGSRPSSKKVPKKINSCNFQVQWIVYNV